MINEPMNERQIELMKLIVRCDTLVNRFSNHSRDVITISLKDLPLIREVIVDACIKKRTSVMDELQGLVCAKPDIPKPRKR